MHCDKEFKESAEERFHPDPTTEEREGGGRGDVRGERGAQREREGKRKTGQRVRPRSSAYPLCGSLAFHVVFRLIGN